MNFDFKQEFKENNQIKTKVSSPIKYPFWRNKNGN